MEKDEKMCPLCCEPLDLTDQSFLPCRCGYQVCCFCYSKIKDEMNGLCPACRQPYDNQTPTFIPPKPEQIREEQNKHREEHRRNKSTNGTGNSISSSRRHLQNVRVIQRNLVYVIGVALELADEKILGSKEYLGRFGPIHKVVVNQKNLYNAESPHGPSVSAYVTYVYPADALECIRAIDGSELNGRKLGAFFGTTKYCTYWLRNTPCPNPDCMFLHSLAHEKDSFVKEEMNMGRTTFREKIHPSLSSAEPRSRGARKPQQLEDGEDDRIDPAERRLPNGGDESTESDHSPIPQEWSAPSKPEAMVSEKLNPMDRGSALWGVSNGSSPPTDDALSQERGWRDSYTTENEEQSTFAPLRSSFLSNATWSSDVAADRQRKPPPGLGLMGGIGLPPPPGLSFMDESGGRFWSVDPLVWDQGPEREPSPEETKNVRADASDELDFDPCAISQVRLAEILETQGAGEPQQTTEESTPSFPEREPVNGSFGEDLGLDAFRTIFPHVRVNLHSEESKEHEEFARPMFPLVHGAPYAPPPPAELGTAQSRRGGERRGGRAGRGGRKQSSNPPAKQGAQSSSSNAFFHHPYLRGPGPYAPPPGPTPGGSSPWAVPPASRPSAPSVLLGSPGLPSNYSAFSFPSHPAAAAAAAAVAAQHQHQKPRTARRPSRSNDALLPPPIGRVPPPRDTSAQQKKKKGRREKSREPRGDRPIAASSNGY